MSLAQLSAGWIISSIIKGLHYAPTHRSEPRGVVARRLDLPFTPCGAAVRRETE